MTSQIEETIKWFRQIYLVGIPFLLKQNDTAFLSFVCDVAAIDALAGYRYDHPKVGDRFKNFITSYFPPTYASHAANLYLFRSKKGKWDWLERAFILAQVSKKLGKAIRGYREYVQRGIVEDQEDPLKKAVASTVIGSEEFTEWVREKWIKRGVDREVPALRAIGKKPDISCIIKACEKAFRKDSLESRRMALYLSHHISGLSLKEVGEYFGGVSISAVSQNSLRQEKRFKENAELLRTMMRLKETILS